MLEMMLNSVKPILRQKLVDKCQEKLNQGETVITIKTETLEELLSKYLGVDFIEIDMDDNNDILLYINKDKLNGN